MDVRSIIANSVQEPGFHRQQRARTRLPSPTGFASAIPWDLVGVRSSDHRRAGPAAIPTGGDLVGCSIDHRRPGQQQESPREGTWLEFDRSSPTGPCLHTSVERVTMSTHIGRESTDRAGRKKVCRVSVLFPLGAIGRNALEGPKQFRIRSEFCPSSVRVNSDNSRS